MLAVFGVLVLLALMIPIVAIVLDSPVGRALGRRLEGPSRTPVELEALQKRVEVLESELSEMGRTVETLREENQFVQKLLDTSKRSTLPPPTSP